MPIIFTDNHNCQNCDRVFEWNYFELRRNKYTSLQEEVETIPEDKVLAYSCNQNDNGTYAIIVNCPHCDYENRFNFTKK